MGGLKHEHVVKKQGETFVANLFPRTTIMFQGIYRNLVRLTATLQMRSCFLSQNML